MPLIRYFVYNTGIKALYNKPSFRLWRNSRSSDSIYDMKELKPLIVACVLGVAFLTPLFAQDGEGAVFAPYPSRIRVGVRGHEIVLSWQDSPDVSAGYAVYRHSKFPEAANFEDAMLLGYAETGEDGFVYSPPDEGAYYYFVLGRASDPSQGYPEYRIFIPLRNIPIEPVSVSMMQKLDEEASASLDALSETATTVAPVLSGILVRVDKDAIVVSIDAKGNPGRLVVYRSTAPIKTPTNLLDSVLAAILEPGSGPYRDYPVPGVDYYYAVVTERDLSSGTLSLKAGVNVSSRPVSIQAGMFRIGLPSSGATSRTMPLPYLILTSGFVDAKPIGVEDPTPRLRELSAETEKAIATIVSHHGSMAQAGKPPITIFPEDLQSGGGGEEYALRSIVAGQFAKGSYLEAIRQFTLYLSLPRSFKNANRARFYRGQAEAMLGGYREAFFDLLQAQESYYMESSAWMDFILERLSRT